MDIRLLRYRLQPVRGKLTHRGQAPNPGWRRRAATTIRACSWLYVAAVVGLWVILDVAADRWWFATLVMYGPRWLWALPLGVLVPAAAIVRPRSLWPLLASLGVVVGPVMDFQLSWNGLW